MPHEREIADFIPVMRPLLPAADRLAPYLRRIDGARTYSNWGPLVAELEQRLSVTLGSGHDSVVCAASGTASLVGAILAAAGRSRPQRPLALLPAFTFVGTAAAVQQCGYEPLLADVDADTWSLDAERIAAHPFLEHVGVVVPVAPFGRPVAQKPWLAFQQRTGIPVVIDAAAGFEAVTEEPHRLIGDVPVVLSFHATKSFGTGEGGCVVTTDLDLAKRTSQALNFGFFGSRNSSVEGINGKMSEYHAAIGLAGLDEWTSTRDAFRDLGMRYRTGFASHARADDFFGAPTVAGCYALFRCSSLEEAGSVRTALTRSNIDFRQWYGGGLACHDRLAEARRDELTVNRSLAPRLLGLPVAPDLPDAAVTRIVAAVAHGCAQ